MGNINDAAREARENIMECWRRRGTGLLGDVSQRFRDQIEYGIMMVNETDVSWLHD
jgi:hypothetical protein